MTALPGDSFLAIVDRPSRALSSVLRGCYVMPHDGLSLDATFKIIRHAVASILILSTSNAGIPLALAFRPTGDSELYETFYNVMAAVRDRTWSR
jgi:hypothetical protein